MIKSSFYVLLMIKMVNGIPGRLVEMDEKVKFLQQIEQDVGPIMLLAVQGMRWYAFFLN